MILGALTSCAEFELITRRKPKAVARNTTVGPKDKMRIKLLNRRRRPLQAPGDLVAWLNEWGGSWGHDRLAARALPRLAMSILAEGEELAANSLGGAARTGAGFCENPALSERPQDFAGARLVETGTHLRHTQVQTTARYAHLAVDPVKAAADQVSSTIAAALA